MRGHQLFATVAQVLAVLVLPSQVIGGELVEADILAAKSALLKQGDEGKDFQFEPQMSGCIFTSCSTELVRFRRDAAFTKIISEPGSILVRKRKVSCFSHDKQWDCYPDEKLLAYVEGTNHPISISAALTDAAVLDIISFFASACFRNQANAYEREHHQMPAWALRNVYIYAIEPKEERYRVSIGGPGVYTLKSEATEQACNYSVQSFGIIRS